jgi:hypothetical protein
MKNLVFLFACLISISAYSQNSFNGFFKPIPKPDIQNFMDSTDVQIEKKWRPVVSLPAFKLVESSREDAVIDALVLTSTGGGISYQVLEFDASKDRWKSKFSFSPATILLSGNLTSDNPIDISYAMSVGFFDNLIMLGAGVDLGSVPDRSRFFGMISVGINFNN